MKTFILLDFQYSGVLFIYNESWKYESSMNPIQDQTSSRTKVFKSVNIVIG